jgi:hypothetical protein
MLEKMKKGKTNNTSAMACCPQNIVRFLSKKLPSIVKSGMLSVVFEARKTFVEGLGCKIDDFFTLQINCSLTPACICATIHESLKSALANPTFPTTPKFFFFSIL